MPYNPIEVEEVDLEEIIKQKGFEFNMIDLRGDKGFQHLVKTDIATKRIHPVRHKSSKTYYILKIPLVENSREKCETAYNVFKQVKHRYGNTDNLVRLVGDEPISFGEYMGDDLYGVLTEIGNMDLGRYSKSSKLKEKKTLEIFYDVAKGLQKLHELGLMHRDIKPSNIIGYEQYNEWALGDYETATENDDTTSSKNVDAFKSPELLDYFSKYQRYNYTFEEDIFQFGVSMYAVISGKIGFFKGANKKKVGYPEYINQTINDLKVNNDMKYFLKRLCGERAPDSNKIPKGKTLEDYRYTHISQFVEEVKIYLEKGTIKKTVVKKTKLPEPPVKKEVKTKVVGKKRYDIHQPIPIVEDPAKHLDYQRFLKEHDNFLNNLGGAKNNNNGMWNTINHQTIDGLMKSYDTYLTWANKKTVKRVPQRNELFESGIKEYELIRNQEWKLLKPIEEQLSTKKKDELEYFIKTIFLWGPPFTTPDKERNKNKGKARYGLSEINKIYYIKNLNNI